MTMKATHSFENITDHLTSVAVSHPRRLESLVERHILLSGLQQLKQCALASKQHRPTDCSLYKQIPHATTIAGINMLV